MRLLGGNLLGAGAALRSTLPSSRPRRKAGAGAEVPPEAGPSLEATWEVQARAALLPPGTASHCCPEESGPLALGLGLPGGLPFLLALGFCLPADCAAGCFGPGLGLAEELPPPPLP